MAGNISNIKYRPIPQEYLSWVQKRLHGQIIKVNLSDCFLDDDHKVYCEQDKSNDLALVYSATSEEDLKLWLLKCAAERAGQKQELLYRPIESLKWRYTRDDKKTTPGHVVLKEQKHYLHDAEYDSRKWWMEYVLKCLKPECSEQYFFQVVEEYSACMNLWFETPHWFFDAGTQEFVEI